MNRCFVVSIFLGMIVWRDWSECKVSYDVRMSCRASWFEVISNSSIAITKAAFWLQISILTVDVLQTFSKLSSIWYLKLNVLSAYKHAKNIKPWISISSLGIFQQMSYQSQPPSYASRRSETSSLIVLYSRPTVTATSYDKNQDKQNQES
jgi:hypothetical protein